MPGIPGSVLQTLIVPALVGIWVWSLISAIEGNRHWLVGALRCTTLPMLFTLYNLVFYSPIPYGWPLLQISVWTTFTLCLLSGAALVYQVFAAGRAG